MHDFRPYGIHWIRACHPIFQQFRLLRFNAKYSTVIIFDFYYYQLRVVSYFVRKVRNKVIWLINLDSNFKTNSESFHALFTRKFFIYLYLILMVIFNH